MVLYGLGGMGLLWNAMEQVYPIVPQRQDMIMPAGYISGRMTFGVVSQRMYLGGGMWASAKEAKCTESHGR